MKKNLLLLAIFSFFLLSCSDSKESTIDLSSEKAIIAFTLNNEKGIIDEEEKTITFSFPTGTDVTKLSPNISISENATLSPSTTETQDFTNAVQYKVTAEDGSIAIYTVRVSVAKNTEADLLRIQLAFSDIWFEGYFNADQENKTVILPAQEYGFNRMAIMTRFLVSPGATVEPKTETRHDYDKPFRVTVTSEDGLATKTYMIGSFEILPYDSQVNFVSQDFADHTLAEFSGRFAPEAENNQPFIIVEGEEIYLEIVEIKHRGYFTAKLPANIPLGEYTAGVISNGTKSIAPKPCTIRW